jgi:hypothetical protein
MRGATFLPPVVEIRKRNSEPNWNAEIGVAVPAVVKAFGVALNETRDAYDIDWPPSLTAI